MAIDARATRRGVLTKLAALAATPVAARVWAADAQPAAASAADAGAALAAPSPLRAELVKTGLYLITGGGGNVLLRLSPAGAVLVNGKEAGMYRPLTAQLRRISRLSDLPVRVLMLTDTSEHHAANQALFAAAGVATLVQRSGAPLLAASPPASSAAARAPAPVVTFDREYRLKIGGIEVTMVHVGPARTPADAVVLFPDLKVLAVGDLYASTSAAATLTADERARWSRALADALRLDFELAVPSEGAPLSRAELEAFKARLDALVLAPGAAPPKP